ncbi:MAG: GAF domain-containing protein [Candidatus Methylomirabilales bacterium]
MYLAVKTAKFVWPSRQKVPNRCREALKAVEQAGAYPNKAPDISDDRRESPCILVVDDEPGILRVLRGVLERQGYTVLTATSGTAATELVRTHPVNLVVLDILMPDVDGIAVCRHIKDDPNLQHIPVILLTAKDAVSDRVLGLEMGADDYMTKPFSGEELVARIHAHLRTREAAQSMLHRNRELSLLNAVADAVGRSLNKEEVLRAALQKIGELEEVQSAYVLLENPEGGAVRMAGDDLTACREATASAIEAEILRKGLPRCYPDVSQSADLSPIPVPNGSGSFAVIPLMRARRIMGVLGVFSHLPTRFGEAEVRLFTAVGRHLTMALTNAQLYTSLAQLVSQIHALSPGRTSVISAPVMDEVMRDVVKRFLETLGVDRCAIILGTMGEETAHLIVGYDGFEENPWIEGVNLSMDRHPDIRRVLETRQPLAVTDVTQEPLLSGIQHLLLSASIRSMLVVPLVMLDQSIGVVRLSSRGAVRKFTHEEIELCQTLANQAALTIEKSPPLREARERANKTQALIRLTKLMAVSLNLQEVYDFAVQAAAEFLEVPCVRLWVADEERRELVEQASYGLQEFSGSIVDRIPYGKGVVGRIMEGGEPQYIADVRQESQWSMRQFLEEAGIVSFAGIPLTSEGRILGVLSVFTQHRRLFTADERTLMGAFANQAAIAIGNARAYQQTQRVAATVAELHEATAQVSGSLDLDDTLDKIARGAAALADAASSVIILRGEEGKDPHVRDWKVGEIEVREDGVSREVLRSGRAVRFPDFAVEPPGKVNPRLLELGRRAAVCLPLHVRDRVEGVMWVHYNEPRRLAEEDFHLLASFANQAAIAIDNARLFAETRRLANTDALTGLYNHRYFYHILDTEVKRARRYGRSLSLIMVDIDYFKNFNDRYGHLAGDEVLRALAQVLQKNSRRVDTVARYGGDEFAIILPETDLAQAAAQAQRLRTAAGEERWRERDLTISIGAAALTPDMARGEDLVREADRALYQAKAAGRNQLCLASPLPGDVVDR